MATFWERDAHSVYSMFSLYFDIVILVISHFGFEGVTLVLITSVPIYFLTYQCGDSTDCLKRMYFIQ